MLKLCYVCGNKEKSLFEGMCEECFRKKSEPVEDFKPLNLKICNMCKKIHYKNQLYTLEEFYTILPKILKERLVINKNYILKSISIENYGLDKEDLIFDTNIDFQLKI